LGERSVRTGLRVQIPHISQERSSPSGRGCFRYWPGLGLRPVKETPSRIIGLNVKAALGTITYYASRT